MLAESVKRQTGAKVRSIELSLLQRCASHVASKTDIDEAYMAGKAAVEAAVAGQTDKMVAFERSTENGQYVCKAKLIGLTDVANVEKLVPREWINPRGNGMEQPFIDYVLPLIQGETSMRKEHSLPRFREAQKNPGGTGPELTIFPFLRVFPYNGGIRNTSSRSAPRSGPFPVPLFPEPGAEPVTKDTMRKHHQPPCLTTCFSIFIPLWPSSRSCSPR